MTHDFDSREWADNHEVLSDGIDRFFRSLMNAFRTLNRIEFDAPWLKKDGTVV